MQAIHDQGLTIRLLFAILTVTVLAVVGCSSDAVLSSPTAANAPGSLDPSVPSRSPSPAFVPTATPTPIGWVHPDGRPIGTSTPVVIPDHNFEECNVVDEFGIAPSGGLLNVPLLASTAIDEIRPRPTPYNATELLSKQPDASLRLDFTGMIPTSYTQLSIERVGETEKPQCLDDLFGEGPVWRIDPIDRSVGFGINFSVQLLDSEPVTGETHEFYKILLLTEAAEIKDITADWCCPGRSAIVLGRDARLGYLMVVDRDRDR